MEFFSIGVYNSTEFEFFEKLIKNKIDTFCDIRQRRGVRGSKYSFVNSIRLQNKLEELNIKYEYIQSLAPTTDIRELQKKVDKENYQLKSNRQALNNVFITEYKNKILNSFNYEIFIAQLEKNSAKKVALFCVEEHHQACHRSILAEKLSEKYNYKITHL